MPPLSPENEDKMHDKIYIDWVKALIIREFWKAKTKMLHFIFDDEVIKDLWISSKLQIFNKLVKEWIISEWPEQDDFHHRVGTLNTWEDTIDEYYRKLIFREVSEDYTNIVQDETTENILAELYPVFGEKITVNLFEFIKTPEKKEEYLLYCNPLISLLRLEYESKIVINWLGSFCFDNRSGLYYAECSLTIQENKNTSHKVSDIEEAIIKAVKDARTNNNEVQIGKEKDWTLLIKSILHFDSSTRLVELQKRYPFAHIETVVHKGKIQGYTVATKEKLTKQ